MPGTKTGLFTVLPEVLLNARKSVAYVALLVIKKLIKLYRYTLGFRRKNIITERIKRKTLAMNMM